MKKIDQLHTSRLIFRKFTENDFDNYYQLAGNINVMKMITGKVITPIDARKKFNAILALNHKEKDTGYYFIETTENNEFVGLGKIVFIEKNEIEIGYMLLPDFWGKGYGREISKKLVDFTKEIESVKTLMAIIDPKNIASKKILLGSGFILDEVGDYHGLPAEIYRLQIKN